MDSPHARGWTAGPRAVRRLPAGFPARAGMDPPPAHVGPWSVGIPRTRGDGPGRRRPGSAGRWDSPHARGWTFSKAMRTCRVGGFPARAGMDPRPTIRPRVSRRIPRTRGDGPSLAVGVPTSRSDSPHARGWTVGRRAAAPAAEGFPARAGMDLHAAAMGPLRGGIPRTRGDGPLASNFWPGNASDSPHARGWTRLVSTRGTGAAGFPARAGMDPRAPAPSGGSPRIPRTRGDGPRTREENRGENRDSPHARGWTRDAHRRVGCAGGFPARAGMDLPIAASYNTLIWIPRTRGDGPRSAIPSVVLRADSPHARGWTPARPPHDPGPPGFPARAGMDPGDALDHAALVGIPRTRGDGPRPIGGPGRASLDSPHARGWTRRNPTTALPGGGFPARAGMDPGGRLGPGAVTRIPRTRGDGPAG